ncbi:porin; major outer membrane protein [Calothrix sp. PCC 7716]|nr:porin; major outer membrane protein [Calothrix sp. PCC 7716]
MLAYSTSANANHGTNIQSVSAEQVTSVSQLSDVQATDWAFQSLQSLVERYGCIAGYPNSTYRGNRAMTRYEFAAGVNACLDRVNELITTATTDLVRKEDLVTLQRLQEEFATELSTLRGRVDVLETKTTQLEASQFSTTTKLDGEVIMALTDVLAANTVNGEDVKNNTTLGLRARLNFETSFTGKDLLTTRIQANNLLNPNIGTPEGRFSFTRDDGTTDAVINLLAYEFPLGEKTSVIAIANEGDAEEITDTVNILDGEAAFGALSRFGTRNPIYYHLDGAGLGITHEFGEVLELSLGYLADDANDSTAKNGLFNGGYGFLTQLTFKPSKRSSVGLTYINSYNQETGTGSNQANPLSKLGVPIISNSYGVQASLGISDKFVLGGWVGYTNTRNLSTAAGTIDRGSADIWNYALTLTFPDLGKEGSLVGIILGMEPKVTSSSINELSPDKDTSYHLEAFYQYRLTDNITITPGLIWLTAPDHNSNNDDVVIGAVRTTFTF